MSENNFKIRATAKGQAITTQSGGATFNQHKFISDIYECEKQKYILEKRQDKLLKSIKQKYSCPSFDNTDFYRKYDKETKDPIKRPQKPQMSVFSWTDELIYGAAKGIPCGIAFTIIHLIVHKIFRGSLDSFELGFGTLIAIIVAVIITIRNKRLNESSYVRAVKAYEASCKKAKETDEKNEKYNRERCEYWNNEYDKYRNKIIEKAQEYENSVMPEVNTIKKELAFVTETLQSLYNLRINGVLCLHPNYHGLVPISIIYGYFDTGRCTQLQGHEGAYNLYEDEKMKNMIITKLDVVSQQLGKLNNSMIYVGQAIEECNSRLADLEDASDRMISSVNSMNSNVSNRLNSVSNQMSAIEENTANSAYYAEVGARMTAFNTAYNLLKD